MSGDGFLDFLTEESLPLIGICVTILGIVLASVFVVRRELPVPNYTDVANIIVAYVALTSLYLAWRELIRKTRPSVTLDFAYDYPEEAGVKERMSLKLTNSGENVVIPVNVWYGYVKRSGDEYYFNNTDMSKFQEDGLQSGETAEVEVGDNVAMIQVTNLNFRDWKGEGVSISDFSIGDTQNRSHIVESGGDLQVKIQKMFHAVMESDIQLGIKYSEEELRTSEVNDILAQADWIDEDQISESAFGS